MSFSSTSGNQMADMNVTPLVDVMLVLLIIFMVTVPALSYPLQMDIGHGQPPVSKTTPPDPVRIRIDASGILYWNGEARSLGQLQALLQAEGARGISASGVVDASQQAAIVIAADPNSEYQAMAQVLARVKNSNLAKVSFD